MKSTTTIDKETNKLVIASILIAVGIGLILRGIKQGNLILLTGLTMLADYFNLDERASSFTINLVSLVERGKIPYSKALKRSLSSHR